MRARVERGQGALERPFEQRRDVLHPFAQRRQAQAQHGQPIEQVGPEAAVLYARFQVAVGGADHAHIDRHGPRAAHAHHFAFFKDAQQSRLQAQGHLADLVEKQRAAIGRLEQARVATAARAGEGAVLVAEQFRFQQRLGNGPAIDGDERTVRIAPRTFAVDRLGHQFLAAARFPFDQHGAGRARIQHHGLAQPLHRGRVAAQVVQAAPQPLLVGRRAPSPAAIGLEPGQARQFERIVERLPDRRRRIQEHGAQAGFLGQVGDRPGADDDGHARRLELIDGGARIFLRHIAALEQIDAEARCEIAQFRQQRAVADDADGARPVAEEFARAGERLQHIESAGLGRHHRHRHAALEPGSVRAGRDDHVAVLGCEALADMSGCLIETELQGLDGRQMVVLDGDVAQQAGQTRDGHRPDDGLVLGGRGGQIHVSSVVQIAAAVSD